MCSHHALIKCILVYEWFGRGFVSAVSFSTAALKGPDQVMGCCSYVMLAH